jgi:charged multivesicular body protein 3
MVRVAGTLSKSNEVMRLVNESLKLPELQRTMMEMSRGEAGGAGARFAACCRPRFAARHAAARWRVGAQRPRSPTHPPALSPRPRPPVIAEMQRAGLIEEMTSEALDSALGGEDIEEETDEAVDAVLREVAGEVLAALPAAKVQPVSRAGVRCVSRWAEGSTVRYFSGPLCCPPRGSEPPRETC